MGRSTMATKSTSIEGKVSKPSLASRAVKQLANVDKMELRKVLRYMRIGNIACSLFQIIAGISGLFGFLMLDIKGSLVSLYVILFGLLFFLYECRLSRMEARIRSKFGFLYSYKGRAGFIFFIGFLDFGINSAMGTVAGVLMCLNSFLNLFIMYKHPDFQGSINANTNPTASYSTGNSEVASYLRSNPQAAMQATSFALNANRV
jgi:hypothetical protein